MEKIKTETMVEEQVQAAEMVTFISMSEIEAARKELRLNKIDETIFSDGEMILAIQEKERLAASTVVPIIVDWMMERNFIMTGPQAVNYLKENHSADISGLKFHVIGDVDLDTDGKFYLVVASTPQRKIETIFKVYINGVIRELWAEN